MFGMVEAALTLRNLVDEEERFIKMCKSLPDDVAEKLKQERRDRLAEDEKHRKALEIADAGRARNFWGN